MKHFGENKPNFFDSTSFLLSAVLAVLAATVFLPLSTINGEKVASPNVLKTEQTAEFRLETISDDAFWTARAIDCPMKSKERNAGADNAPNCQRAVFSGQRASLRKENNKN